MKINPLTAIDFYKTDHRRQYPTGTTEVYSNFTPRSSKLAKVLTNTYDNHIVFFGLQYFLMDFLINDWNEYFFNQPKEHVIAHYKRRMDNSLGKNAVATDHIAALHDLGYFPLKIKALPEGTRIPIGVPVLTMVNTHPEFFWLTNYIETIISSYLWKPCTSATTAFEYKKLLTNFADKTGSAKEFVQFQAHDFSFRGMSGIQDAALSGAAHLACFWGTDTVPAIDLCEEFYCANSDNEMIGCSVPATEHSVMCMGMQAGELDTFKRLITELYPQGIVSIVSDTWDFWRVVTEFTVELKTDILARDGKVVIRPDSGDPVKIVAGDPDAPVGSPEYKGAVQCLWEIFGGTQTDKGFNLLNEHIGLIYGDSITLERAEAILTRLAANGFASGNVVFGIGSYTYQYVTRDNFGFAMKATSGVVNGERREICKDPKTDSGLKNLRKVYYEWKMKMATWFYMINKPKSRKLKDYLQLVYQNGKLINPVSLAEIRSRIDAALLI